MASINLFVGVGRIVRDVEPRQIKPGLTVATFSIAMEHKLRTKEGEKKEICYMDVTVWNEQAVAASALKKGTEVFVKGRLKQEEWQDKKTGDKRTKHVLMADTLIHHFNLDSRAYEPALSHAFEPTSKNTVENVQRQATIASKNSYEDMSIDSDLPF